MSFQQYQQLSQSAVLAYHDGQHREAADKYASAWSAAPGKWTENRWQIFRGYTSILCEKYFVPSSSDLKTLSRIVKDKSEPKLYRCEAARTFGLLSWDAKNREDAAEQYREAIRLGKKTHEKERKRKVEATILSEDGTSVVGIGMRNVGEIIDETIDGVQSNLKRLENKRFNGSNPNVGPHVRSDGTAMPQDTRMTRLPFGLLGTSLSLEQTEKLMNVGGNACDCCGKTLAELAMNHLKACGRCKKAYYCSEQCQKRQWNAGHKKTCRKTGQIKPGDYVKLTGILSRPEINDEIVEVIKAAPNQEGRWEVRITGGERSISVAAEKMEQLRPLK